MKSVSSMYKITPTRPRANTMHRRRGRGMKQSSVERVDGEALLAAKGHHPRGRGPVSAGLLTSWLRRSTEHRLRLL